MNKFYRADKLLEEVMDARMASIECTEEAKKDYQIVKAQADAYTREELMAVFAKYEIKAPDSGNELTEPQEFNLMFPTPIGPTGLIHGYLRPETAQGIFLNFKFCLEQNAGVMPFGIAQVGKVFRNEIAPRSGLIRCREFTQAEIEFFVHPDGKKHPKFGNVAEIELQLFASPQQLAAEPPVKFRLGEAVARGIVANETLGYFIGRTYEFLLRAGCRAEHVRFRQHLPDEMAHYACDCWDAEIEMSLGWVECVGIADRSAFDLSVHAKATNTSLTAQRQLETPRVIEKFGLSKKALAKMGKFFKKDAKVVGEWLTAQSAERLRALEAEAKAEGSATIVIGEMSFTIAAELLEFEKTVEKQNVEIYTPNVIEPSFGIDRILTALYEHSFYIRKHEADVKEKSVQGVLALPAEIAPYKCVVLPLDMRVVAAYNELLAKTRHALADHGLQYKIDESGASIGGVSTDAKLHLDLLVPGSTPPQCHSCLFPPCLGKRYARSDELGIPFAITIDFDTIGQSKEDRTTSQLVGTATLRERDSTEQARQTPTLHLHLCHVSRPAGFATRSGLFCASCIRPLITSGRPAIFHQVRLPLDNIPALLGKLCSSHPLTWADLIAAYGSGGSDSLSSKSSDMLKYLGEHGITSKLNSAVNELANSKPDDPVAFLVKALEGA